MAEDLDGMKERYVTELMAMVDRWTETALMAGVSFGDNADSSVTALLAMACAEYIVSMERPHRKTFLDACEEIYDGMILETTPAEGSG